MRERAKSKTRRRPVSSAAPAKPAAAQREKREADERLDEALEETFPASDPIAVSAPPDGPKASG
jgi:hypothetical protein